MKIKKVHLEYLLSIVNETWWNWASANNLQKGKDNVSYNPPPPPPPPTRHHQQSFLLVRKYVYPIRRWCSGLGAKYNIYFIKAFSAYAF